MHPLVHWFLGLPHKQDNSEAAINPAHARTIVSRSYCPPSKTYSLQINGSAHNNVHICNWFANKTITKALDCIQCKAMNWITNYIDLHNTERLDQLNLLPLSLYIEMNELLVLSKIISYRYKLD